MPTGYPVDINEVHEKMWQDGDRFHRIRLNQGTLAAELGVTKYTMSRVIAKMVEDTRIRRVSSTAHNKGIFIVMDPGAWRDLDEGY